MPVKMNGATSGYAQIQAGATAANNTLTLPDGNATLVDTSSTQTLTNKTLTSPSVSNPTFTGTVTAAAITASGNVTVGGDLIPSSSFLRNRIINGNMVIDQRNAGASTTPAASGYLLDRFAWSGSIGSKLTFGQNLNAVTPPTGFTKYLGAQTASATTPSATEYYSEYQIIEGYNMADFGWGTANAKTVTLSFVAYSSLTGTFGGSIYNSAANRCYPFSYSIPAANTWTTISITVAGDTTGTWATDNTVGAVIMFGLGAGASVSGTAGAWGSTLYRSSTGAVQVVATASATFYLTGVQLEVGSNATPFERQIYSTQLAMCQRYYWRTIGAASAFPSVAGASFAATAAYGTAISFPVQMRTTPTVNKNGTWTVSNSSQPTVQGTDQNGFYLVASGTAASNAAFAPAGSTTYLDTSGAEL